MADASNRVTHVLLVLVLFALLAVLGMLATTARGGPLDPPGSPSSTDGVRLPGTPISSLPFTISQPGNYYLSRNLTGAEETNGITINASSVTLNLGGFELLGSGTGTGVNVTGSQSGIRIHNGVIRGWNEGVLGSMATRSRVDQVTVTGTIFRGVLLGRNSVVEDCNVSENLGEGIRADYSTVRNCTISDNFYSGLVLDTGNYVHHNRIIFNNSSNTVGFRDVRVLGDENRLTDNFATTLGFEAASSGNRVYRSRVCAFTDTGTNNFVPSAHIDTGGGHLAIHPGLNEC